MIWMIYQANLDAMVTVIKQYSNIKANALSFLGKTETFTAESSELYTWKEAFKK